MALSPKQISSTIIECTTNHNIMSLTYKRERDGRIITRQVEPYEVKKKGSPRSESMYLYAYDNTGSTRSKKRVRSIKSFLLNNIVSVRNTNRKFVPRYE